MPVIIGIGIQEKVRAIEAVYCRFVIVVDVVRVPQFASVIGLVACSLQPDREIVIVDAFADDLRIPSYNTVRSLLSSIVS